MNLKLAAMNKKFVTNHGLSSLANIMSFGSLASCDAFMVYLACKINFQIEHHLSDLDKDVFLSLAMVLCPKKKSKYLYCTFSIGY